MRNKYFIYFFKELLKKNKSENKTWCIILSYFSRIKYMIFFEGGGGSKVPVNSLRYPSLLSAYKGFGDSSIISEEESSSKDSNKKKITPYTKKFYKEGKYRKPWKKRFYGQQSYLNLPLPVKKTLGFEFRERALSLSKLRFYIYKIRPLHMLLLSVDIVTPVVGIKVSKVGSVVYRIPKPITLTGGIKLSIRWMVLQMFSRRLKKDGFLFYNSFKLIQEESGPIVNMQKEVYKVAIQNRPFVRYLKLC